MSEDPFDLEDLGRSSILTSYSHVVASNRDYFEDPDYVDDDDKPIPPELEWFVIKIDASSSRPIDRAALDYLVDVVGVSRQDVRRAGWASCLGPDMRSRLVAPAVHPDRGLLAVRAIAMPPPRDYSENLKEAPRLELDPSDWLVEADPNAALAVDDVPVPFRRGLLDKRVTWVSNDPLDAFLLRSLRLNATSLAKPFQTLGSEAGLWHLQDLGVLTPRDSPTGTLVVIDPLIRPTEEQEGLLNGQFREVLTPGAGYTGRHFWELVRGARREDEAFRNDPLGTLIQWMKEQGGITLQADPVALRPRWDGPSGPRQPFTFVPVSELFRHKVPGPEWIVKGFVSPGTITQFLGGSKAGKSTLLLSMLAEVSRGGTFLGEVCKQGPVLYVTEQGRGSFGASLERSLPTGTTALDLPDLHALTAEKLYGRSWADVLALVRATSKRLGARVVVFDTLSEAADVHGDAENSAGASRMLYRTLRGLVGDGTAVVAVRHTRKDERGGIAESGLGSVANSGAADHLVRVREEREGSSVRRIDTKGRIADADDFFLKLTPDGWVRVEGTPAEDTRVLKTAKAGALILAVLQQPGNAGLERKALMAEFETKARGTEKPVPTKADFTKALKALVESGQVSEEVGVGSGRPRLFRFVLPPTP